ncbi:hypothetical protein ACFLWW_02020 [Chloroflexota bacterium]
MKSRWQPRSGSYQDSPVVFRRGMSAGGRLHFWPVADIMAPVGDGVWLARALFVNEAIGSIGSEC